MRKIYLMVIISLISAVYTLAQTSVKGKVVSSKGEPLPGVSVLVEGTTIATATNEVGEFEIAIPSSESETGKKPKLIFSFIGFKTLTIDADKDLSNLVLEEDSKMIDEVIVSGMAIEKDKARLGYAVQNISGEELSRSKETNIVNALNGKVAGVQIVSSAGTPGASSTIRIRGTNTFGGNFQPLFVVDGIPIDNSEVASAQERDGNTPFLQGVNNSNRAVDLASDDIETITVLKGPAATALYGIRAANGAIIITTKKGKFNSGKPQFSFNVGYSVEQVNKLPEFQNKYSQGTNGRYRRPETNVSASWGSLVDTLRYNGVANPYTGEEIVGVSAAPGGSRIKTYENPKNFFVLGSTRNLGFSATAGTDKTNYMFSVNNVSQQGVIPLSSFERTSIRLNTEFKFSQKLTFMSSVNYINSGGVRLQQGSNLSGLMLGLFRTPITFDNSGGYDKPWTNEKAFLLPDGRQRAYRAFGTYDNPYFSVARNQTRDNVNRIITFGQLRYEINENLSVLYRLGIDHYGEFRRGGFDVRAAAFPEGRTFEHRMSSSDVTSDLIVNYTKRFGKFDVVANAGHNYFDSKFGGLYSQGDGLTVPNYQSLSNASSYLAYQNNVWLRRYGVYVDLNLGYNNRYFLNVTGRNDWTSTLTKRNNSFFYPSLGASYLISEDLKDFNILPSDNNLITYWKLKGSWAQVGRDAPAYSTYNIYGQPLVGDGYTNGIPFPYAGINGLQAGTSGGSSQPALGNPNLQPEVNTTWELGTELSFFNKRLGLDFTYYNTNNKNLIVSAQIASSSGFQYRIVNAGEVETKGIEVVLNAVPVKTANFQWETGVNLTRYRNKVITLGEGIENLFLNGFVGSGSFAIPGQPFGVFYGTSFMQVDGKYLVDPDGNYVIDPQSRVLGDPNPKLLVGWRNTLSYKSIYLTALLDIRVGGHIWNGTRGALEFFGTHKNTEDRSEPTKILEGIKADYDGTVLLDGDGRQQANDVPIPTQVYWQFNRSSFGGANNFSMEEVNWVRLRDISIGYTFPKSLTSKLKLTGLDFSLFARNALLITNYTGIDPETNLTGTSSGSGIDYFNMPNTRSFGANLKVTF